MRIDHIAIWTKNLEVLKDFYVKFFNGTANEKYINPKTRFESYFVSFDSGARIEIMSRPDIPDNENDALKQYMGIIHFAFEVSSKEEVDQKAGELKNAGFEILRGPRTTGDGFYEFETLDPDKNRLEVTAKA